jgi:DNA modification methylase
MIPISKFKQNPDNPRTIKKDQLEKLKRSIKSFPEMMEKRPMVCVTDEDGKLYPLGGNMRLRAIKEMGFKEVPETWVALADEWTEEQRREFIVKDNASLGAWDFDALAEGWNIDDLEEWGVDLEWDKIEKLEAKEDDFDVELPEEPKTVLGDLYEIGEHRLLCGDSTDSEQVAKLMNGEKADMVLSDPPYGMFLDADYSSLNWGGRKGKKYDNVIGDHDDFDPELINTFFKHFDYCKEMFLWGADYYFELLPDFKKGNYIVWDKTLESNGDAGSNSEYELCWSRQKHKRVVLHFNWFRYFGLQSQDTKTRVHPTQKPLEVNNHFIERYSKEQDKIIDLYLGSGSTMVASHQLKRKCYGMELDPKYCDVIVNRMIKLDPDIRIKRNGVDVTESFKLK